MDPFISSIIGVGVGGGITYGTQWAADKRRTSREAQLDVAKLYSDAMAAVAAVQAARWGPGMKVQPGTFPNLSDSEMAEAIAELERGFLKEFLIAKKEARMALAALYAQDPDLKAYWDKNEVAGEEEFGGLMTRLAESRRALVS
jgi:hypothetical protein